jgi:hypothetical protein
MITNNGKKLIKCLFREYVSQFNSAYVNDTTDDTVTMANGSTILIRNIPNTWMFPSKGNSSYLTATNGYKKLTAITSNSMGVVFGSGTTAPTENDIDLETSDTASTGAKIAASVIGASNYIENGKYYSTVSYTIKNNTNADITIAEIGMYQPSTSSNDNTKKPILIDRTVLDEPVTIPAGETRQIKYTLCVDWDI